MTFAHLHNHTDYSALDGLTFPAEAAGRAASLGQSALAITDHGVCSGHPAHQKACDDEGIKPIFGMEGYWVPDRLERPAAGDKEAQQRLRANRHLILLAASDKGLRDLWALSTEAYASGFYYRPRCDDELLERYGSDLIVTTSCLGGLVSRDLLDGSLDAAGQRLARWRDMFPGRFYLEIQGNALPEQRRLNMLLAQMGDILDIPLVAASDAHYPSAAESELHRLWMSCQTSPANDAYWNYIHMQDESEVRDLLGYLDPRCVDSAIHNSFEIAEQCNARIGGIADPPHFTASHEEDASLLLDLCIAAWDRIRVPGRKQEYRDRLEREWQLVSRKHLAGCYLIVHDVIRYARSRGELPGPGRGSAAGSLMSYLLAITSMDPVRTGLMFERFVTPGRTSLPDFDMDFASSARTHIQDYVISKYGAERVVRVGTHMRYRSKAVLNKLFSILRPDVTDDPPRIASIIDEAESHTAGLGLPWDDLMEEAASPLEAFIERYAGVFEAASRLVGHLNSYGQHPAGLVISTSQDLASSLPMRTGDKGQQISQWDFRTLDTLGLLKLDFLTLRTLDSIQQAIRLVSVRTQQPPDPLSWEAEHDDPQAWDEICAGNTLGMFRIETSLGMDFCRRMKPRSLPDLGALIALVRPGPRNSGVAEAYLRRRAGLEEVTYPHPLLEPYLGRSYGLMIYQEDILSACRVLAGYDDAEADEVRSILGKKKKEKIPAAGEKFVRRCFEHSGIKPEDGEKIFAQIAEFGKYGFNLSHAYSYATLSYWTAWLKAHYPVETITAILSTLSDKDRMPAFAVEARRMGITVLPPDVRISGAGFTAEALSIRYGLSSIKGLGPAALTSITAAQPYQSMDDFVARSKADAGVIYALAQAGALDPLVASRRALVMRLQADRSGDATRCTFKDESVHGPNELPCTFDWASEPEPEPRYGRKGQPLKVIPLKIPARCTRACRHYSPPALSFAGVPEYSAGELWRLETDIYGTWMTPAAFEEIDAIQPGLRMHSRNAARLLPGAPRGSYPVIAVHDGLRSAITRRGSVMWWQRLVTEVSVLSVAVFSPRREDDPDLPSAVRYLQRGTVVLAEVVKDSYVTPSGQPRVSWRLESVAPLKGSLS